MVMAHVKASMPLFDATAAARDAATVLADVHSQLLSLGENPTPAGVKAATKAANKSLRTVVNGLQVSDA